LDINHNTGIGHNILRRGDLVRFILVRHGQTSWNINKKFCGHSDIPLNETGVDQARVASEKLKDEHIDKAYSSDLSRAVQTAESVMSNHDLPLIQNTTLREMYFGKWEGLTYDEIHKNYPTEADVWVKDYMNVPSLGGESLKSFYERVGKAFDDIKNEVQEHDTVLIVAHAGVVQSILTKEIIGAVDGYWKFRVDNGGIAILDYDHEFPILTALNM